MSEIPSPTDESAILFTTREQLGEVAWSQQLGQLTAQHLLRSIDPTSTRQHLQALDTLTPFLNEASATVDRIKNFFTGFTVEAAVQISNINSSVLLNEAEEGLALIQTGQFKKNLLRLDSLSWANNVAEHFFIQLKSLSNKQTVALAAMCLTQTYWLFSNGLPSDQHAAHLIQAVITEINKLRS